MNEQQVRKIINEELQKKLFGFPKIPPHKHDDKDNIKIPASSIIYSSSAMGKITFAHTKTYTLYFSTPNPTRIDVNGFVQNAGVTIYGLIVGNVALNRCFYFQPTSSSSVTTGGTQYPVVAKALLSSPDSPNLAQCCSSLTIDQSSLANTFPFLDQFRAVHAKSVSGDLISAYFNNLTSKSVDFVVETLATGYQAKLNITIT